MKLTVLIQKKGSVFKNSLLFVATLLVFLPDQTHGQETQEEANSDNETGRVEIRDEQVEGNNLDPDATTEPPKPIFGLKNTWIGGFSGEINIPVTEKADGWKVAVRFYNLTVRSNVLVQLQNLVIFHSKNLNNDQIEADGPTFLNALYKKHRRLSGLYS